MELSSTDSNNTPSRLRRVATAIGDHILGFGVILGVIGTFLTILVLVHLDHSEAPRVKHAIGGEGSIYLGVGIAVTGILVLVVASHRTVRAFRGLIGGAGLLLVASAVLFLFDVGHLPGSARTNRAGSSLKAETRPPSHPRVLGPSPKGKHSKGTGSSSAKR